MTTEKPNLQNPSLMLFRNDLRLRDNPALAASCKHKNVILLFIYEDFNVGYPDLSQEFSNRGRASKAWLRSNLLALQDQLKAKQASLLIRKSQSPGESLEIIKHLCKENRIANVYWNRRYDPQGIATDSLCKKQLEATAISVHSLQANLLYEPWEILKDDKKPYVVYSAFWKRHLNLYGDALPTVISMPKKIQCLSKYSDSKVFDKSLDSLKLLPTPRWDSGFYDFFEPGESAALKRLGKLSDIIDHYDTDRDIPGIDGTSGLSPYLAIGAISPRQIWNKIMQIAGPIPEVKNKSVLQYAKEIFWREFAYSMLYHFPKTPSQNYNSKFDSFPWHFDKNNWRAWTKGSTGYPIVDAGMRQLWKTGWMHNRVRMIVGSFLTKNLGIHWLQGAKWFWDTLIDADLASNTMGWQWVAGCGIDAAPYFRIFNPVTQSKKFDPDGKYIRRWVPELKNLPSKYIHEPWLADPTILEELDFTLGISYPKPIVDLSASRKRALEAYSGL